jgi:hypothetical protein
MKAYLAYRESTAQGYVRMVIMRFATSTLKNAEQKLVKFLGKFVDVINMQIKGKIWNRKYICVS